MRIDVRLMTRPVFLAATAVLLFTGAPLLAGETIPIDWSRLSDPSAQEFEDPYRDLAPQQMSDLMSLVRLREQLGVEGLTTDERGQLEARTAEFEAALAAVGIDVEWLLSQRWVVADRRRHAAVATNAALDGQSVEIAGFLILAPPTESPPPNQLVRLLMKDLPETGGSCVPAVIQGTLRAEETRYEVVVIDHSLPMWSAWTLETNEVSVVDSYQSDTLIQH